jgi:hypothetical protein
MGWSECTDGFHSVLWFLTVPGTNGWITLDVTDPPGKYSVGTRSKTPYHWFLPPFNRYSLALAYIFKHISSPFPYNGPGSPRIEGLHIELYLPSTMSLYFGQDFRTLPKLALPERYRLDPGRMIGFQALLPRLAEFDSGRIIESLERREVQEGSAVMCDW